MSYGTSNTSESFLAGNAYSIHFETKRVQAPPIIGAIPCSQ